MMIFRSMTIGLLAAIFLLSLHHIHDHLHHSADRLAPVVVVTAAAATQPSRNPPAQMKPSAIRSPAYPRPGRRRGPRIVPGAATPPGDTLIVDIGKSTVERLRKAENGSAFLAPVPDRAYGAALHGIRPGSLFAVLGFAPGDVVVSVDGRRVEPPAAQPGPSGAPGAATLFAGHLADFVDISLVRRGQPMRMIVLLH